MNQGITILIFTIIDFIVIWSYFYYQDPDPSVSIALIIIIPLIILINIIIAGFFWVNKKKNRAKTFIINSIISSVIAYFLWGNAIERHQDKIWEIYSFKFQNKNYQINIHKPDNTYGITESTNPGSSWTFQDGIYKKIGEKIILETDSTKYIIENNFISGFSKNTINLNKE